MARTRAGRGRRVGKRPLALLRWFGPAAGDPAEARLWRRIVALGLTVALLSIVHVWIRVKVQDLSGRLQKTDNVLQALDIEHGELVDREARQSSPDNIAHLARERLGLGLARPGQVIPVDAKKP